MSDATLDPYEVVRGLPIEVKEWLAIHGVPALRYRMCEAITQSGRRCSVETRDPTDIYCDRHQANRNMMVTQQEFYRQSTRLFKNWLRSNGVYPEGEIRPETSDRIRAVLEGFDRMRELRGTLAWTAGGPAPDLDPRETYTYVMRMAQWVKIGRSVNPFQRLETVGSGTTLLPVPLRRPTEKIKLLAFFHGDVETNLHSRWRDYRSAGEWFNLTGELDQWVRGLTHE